MPFSYCLISQNEERISESGKAKHAPCLPALPPRSKVVGPRHPLARDTTMLDYENDSDEDWEEEPEGEDLGDDAMVRGRGERGGGKGGEWGARGGEDGCDWEEELEGEDLGDDAMVGGGDEGAGRGGKGVREGEEDHVSGRRSHRGRTWGMMLRWRGREKGSWCVWGGRHVTGRMSQSQAGMSKTWPHSKVSCCSLLSKSRVKVPTISTIALLCMQEDEPEVGADAEEEQQVPC